MHAREHTILNGLTLVTLGLLANSLRRPPIKDWVIVYLQNALTNAVLDKLVVSTGKISYPARALPGIFRTHLLFDHLYYPTFTILFNQLTRHDRPLAIFFKSFLLSVPLTLFEGWANRHTGLIQWKSGWSWYITFVTVTCKTLANRSAIGLIRYISDRQDRIRRRKDQRSRRHPVSLPQDLPSTNRTNAK